MAKLLRPCVRHGGLLDGGSWTFHGCCPVGVSIRARTSRWRLGTALLAPASQRDHHKPRRKSLSQKDRQFYLICKAGVSKGEVAAPAMPRLGPGGQAKKLSELFSGRVVTSARSSGFEAHPRTLPCGRSRCNRSDVYDPGARTWVGVEPSTQSPSSFPNPGTGAHAQNLRGTTLRSR